MSKELAKTDVFESAMSFTPTTKEERSAAAIKQLQMIEVFGSVVDGMYWITLTDLQESEGYKRFGCETMKEFLKKYAISRRTYYRRKAELQDVPPDLHIIMEKSRVGQQFRDAVRLLPPAEQDKIIKDCEGKSPAEMKQLIVDQASDLAAERKAREKAEKDKENIEKKAQKDLSDAADEIANLNQAVAAKAAEGKGGSPYDPAKQRALNDAVTEVFRRLGWDAEDAHKLFDSLKEDVCFAPDFPATARIHKALAAVKGVIKAWEGKLQLDAKRVEEMGLKEWMKAGHMVKPKAIRPEDAHTHEDLERGAAAN